MPARLLIIEHGSQMGGQTLVEAQHFREQTTWENFRPERLLHCQAQLILVEASPETPQVISLFFWLREHPVRIPVLAVLPESPSGELLEAVTEVTDDFVFWPVRGEELQLRIERLVQSRTRIRERAETVLGKEMGLAKLVGKHSSILHAAQQMILFGASNAPVLITGETGTGKELFARAIHSLSKRQSGPLIPVDCGSLPEQLAENELFGHCRGAYTDAQTDQKGLAAMAEGGTLFLDEVDALSPGNQAKLLRFLQEGTYRALGAPRFSSSNARVIAASNRPIEDRVEHGQFRGDLYFRLNVLRLHLPPLRERHGDISLLAKHFLEGECAAGGAVRKYFSPAALRKLESHHWPGNARELFNAVQRAAVCCPGRQIMPEDILLSNEAASQRGTAAANGAFRSAKQLAIERFERAYVERVLALHQGNITQAARAAGKERRAFGRLAKKYGISPPYLEEGTLHLGR